MPINPGLGSVGSQCAVPNFTMEKILNLKFGAQLMHPLESSGS
ncbi:hypothetical protein TcasGA2_TC033478 [Tribolium castaneum]|uniref:Uncharacterized protein n=1 Tax=Tribolium castaneum TaxID=7070 RepID=A0A139WG34_TRICA|nr:hypothetical protein TcasGA2_TC033478 [Tribolium castaneum]